MKKDTLCIITARQGSKGIKNKNIAKLNNKPLLIHSLDFAKRLKFVAKIIISTDSKKYASLCNKNSFKIDHLRPKRLAKDNTKTINVLRYELDKLNDLVKIKYILLLQPTCPFRSIKDFYFGHKMMKSHDSVYSIHEVKDHPSRMYIKKKRILYSYLKSSKEIFERRQKLKKIYIRSGSMYFFKKKNIYKENFYGTKIFGIEVKNKYKINIDNDEDLLLARKYVND